MNTYTARCTTLGCSNAFIPSEINSDEFPVNVVCGTCGSQITNIETDEQPVE